MAGKKDHRAFGWVRKLPSKRYQASYIGPDTRRHTRVEGTFETKIDAEGWLAAERRLIDAGTWTPPRERNQVRQDEPTTVRKYAAAWLADRPLKPRTRDHYAHCWNGRSTPPLRTCH